MFSQTEIPIAFDTRISLSCNLVIYLITGQVDVWRPKLAVVPDMQVRPMVNLVETIFTTFYLYRGGGYILRDSWIVNEVQSLRSDNL